MQETGQCLLPRPEQGKIANILAVGRRRRYHVGEWGYSTLTKRVMWLIAIETLFRWQRVTPVVDEGTFLDRAVRLWEKAQVLYTTPTMSQQLPEPLAVAERIAGEYPQFHDALVDILTSPHQLVVAYALMTLRMMRSPILAKLSEELANRKEKVTIAIGCFLNSVDLGGLARQYRKEARCRAEKAASEDRPDD